MFEYSLRSGEMRVQGSAAAAHSAYTAERIQVQSWDRQDIPLTLISKRQSKPGSTRPCLLLGYGAYGVNLDLDYQPSLAALVDAGWLGAFAHVRGGAEKGTAWYHSGMY